MTEEGKEKRVNIDFEPFKPINTSLYLCDNKFHTEALNELVEDDEDVELCVLARCCFTLLRIEHSLQGYDFEENCSRATA